MKNTILVTGGAGFIGSNLCEQLISEGKNVICVDNLISGTQKNIAQLLTHNNFTFMRQDVIKPINFKKSTKIDEVYHLASPADPNQKSSISYMSHPFETMLVNTIGTWNLCELAIKQGAKLLFSSTSEVYGDPEKVPQDEKYRGNVSTTGPRSVYDESKRFGETIVASFVRHKKLNGRIVRIFNTYGRNMNVDDGRAVVNFIKQALSGEAITIYGKGEQTRSFCYIEDLIEGLILVMKKGKGGNVFNLGSPDERKIIEFAKIIKRLAASKSKIIFADKLPEDDPIRRRPDITKAKSKLGWNPKVSLEDGLNQTIEYFRKIL